jgi:hypothetical protein
MNGGELRRCLAICFCVLLLGGAFGVPASASSVNVPLDHWSYDDIDTLIGFGLIRTALLGTRPFSRDEMARLIAEAIPRREGLPYRQRTVANRLLKRLLREFQDEVNVWINGKDAAPQTFIKPLNDVSMQFVYLDGKPTRMFRESQIDATEGTPLLRNNEGVTYRDGENVMLTASSYAKLWEHFSFYVQPLFLLRSADIGDADVRLHKGYLKASLGPFELELGRDSIWWGQGRRGTLIFSNHARPLEIAQLSMPHPVKLPWIFRYLGLFKTNAFFSVLEKDRDRPRAKVVGLRLDIKPLSWLELGGIGAVQFGGKGVSEHVSLSGIGKFFGFGNLDNVNQLFAFDLRITVPFLRNTEIYFEYGGEDSATDPGIVVNNEGPEFLWGDVAYLVGLYVPRVTDDGRTTFRFEWMQNDFANNDRSNPADQSPPSIWYNHFQFTSGFTYKNRVLGHAAGGDGGEFFWRLTRDITPRITLGGDFSYQWRGDVLLNDADITGRQRERHYRGGVDLRYFVTDQWEVRSRFALEKVDNFNLQPGDDRTNAIFWVNVRFQMS